jgi:hypothetical protein
LFFEIVWLTGINKPACTRGGCTSDIPILLLKNLYLVGRKRISMQHAGEDAPVIYQQ